MSARATRPGFAPPLRRLSETLRVRFARWIRARQGSDALPLRLARRRLYILPSRAGVGFGVLVLLMLLAGLNYGNSLALLLTFVLSAFTLVAMQLCHRNLLGLTVQSASTPPVFAGEPGALLLVLSAPGTGRAAIEGRLTAGAAGRTEVPVAAPATLVVPVPPQRRGVLPLERVRLETRHPFGLFCTWTWLHAPLELLVYPAPRGTLPMPESGLRPGTRRRGSGALEDEWLGLRAFRDGDSPRRVDWKAYAREAPLLVKEYEAAAGDVRLFDFARLPLADTEARLSQLARWIVDAEAQGERYGLSLPGLSVPARRGPAHRHRCLAALARFDGGRA
ncbi:MAG: DUF58 domain-containing protein [Gammaproteobacteria bacterium]|nr:DUF58 domain-containing protein [Gammaproteobacteria bacterium]MBV9695911.1 DUF58 domain-containing protein [Gammaproteobacteria bacterium]